MAGDAYLARQALPHGEEVGLLPGRQAHTEVLQSLLQGHEQPLPPAGEEEHYTSLQINSTAASCAQFFKVV